MGIYSLGFRGALKIIADKETGRRPYVWAKDYLISRYSGVGLSKYMPHVKGSFRF
jgi:hypothetical protein